MLIRLSSLIIRNEIWRGSLSNCWKICSFLYNRKCEEELRKAQQVKNNLIKQITILDQDIRKEKVMKFLVVQKRVTVALNTISWFFTQFSSTMQKPQCGISPFCISCWRERTIVLLEQSFLGPDANYVAVCLLQMGVLILTNTLKYNLFGLKGLDPNFKNIVLCFFKRKKLFL